MIHNLVTRLVDLFTAVAQGGIVLGSVENPPLRPWDVVTASGVRFMRHGGMAADQSGSGASDYDTGHIRATRLYAGEGNPLAFPDPVGGVGGPP